jgi:GntR family transcriptional regulator
MIADVARVVLSSSLPPGASRREGGWMQRSIGEPPVYLRIQEHIRNRIAAGEFGPGDRLPSEAELSAQFATTRATVARALRELAFARVITRAIGRGTFVAHPPVKAPFEPTQILSFEETVGREHGHIEYRVLDVRRVPASSIVAAALGIEEGREAFRLERLRIVAGVPLSLVARYMPLEIGRRISADAISQYSIHHILREDIGSPVVHTDGYIHADTADDRLAELLQVQRDAPLLIRRYTLSDRLRRPLVYGESWFREEFHIAYRVPVVRPEMHTGSPTGRSAP